MGRIFRGYTSMVFWAAAIFLATPIRLEIRNHSIIAMMLLFPIYCVAIWLIVLIPFAVAVIISEKFAIRSKLYFFSVNAVISSAIAFQSFARFKGGFSVSRANFYNYGYFEISFPIILSGTLSALSYWYMSGQYAGSSEEEYKRLSALQDDELP
jgi:hypothetical protein